MREEKMEERTPKRKSARLVLVEKLGRKYPGVALENDEALFDKLLDYEQDLCVSNERLLDGQRKLAALFTRNPRIGALIADVVDGEDALVSCVRHFGKDMLTCADDDERMEQIRRENDAYLERARRNEKLQQQQEENWEKSSDAFVRFQEKMEMDDAEFDDFMHEVFTVADSIFMGKFSDELLETLYRGFHYDEDLEQAQAAAEVRGRNERIVLERERSAGDSLPNLHSRKSAKEGDDDNLTPIFGLKRRRSVWDM